MKPRKVFRRAWQCSGDAEAVIRLVKRIPGMVWRLSTACATIREETLRAQDSAMDSFERARAGNLDFMSQAGVAAEIAQLHASAGRYEEGILEARRALA